MADKKIIQLEQDSVRIKKIFDETDAALKVVDENGNPTENANKFWATDESGNLVTRKISESTEYTTLVDKANEAANSAQAIGESIIGINEDLVDLTERIADIESNMDMIASKINVVRITPATVVRLSTNVGTIDYKFESLDSTGASTGKATVTWRSGGVTGTILKTETIEQGENSFELGNYVKSGDNTITATFVDSLGTSRSINWMVTVVEMELTSTFDDSKVYNTEENKIVELYYTAKGSIEKTIHIKLNDKEVYTQNIGTTNNQQVYRFSAQSHGAHDFELYATATVGEEEVESNHLYFSVMFAEPNNGTPIIRWVYDNSLIRQYKSTVFDYSVYTPGAEESDVELISYDEEEHEETKTTLVVGTEKQQ